KPASITPAASGKTYGAPDPTLTGGLSGFVTADGVTATYNRAPGETVGGNPYTITVSTVSAAPSRPLNNYTITSNTASFTISPRNTSTAVVTSLTPAPTGSLVTF